MRSLILFVVLVLVGVGVGYYFGNRDWSGRLADSRAENFGQNDPRLQEPSSEKEAASIVGIWRSVDDSKFTREFKSDFSVVDRYEGDSSATTEASWRSFMSPTDEQTPFPIEEGKRYIKMTTPEEVMFFTLDKITDSELQLSYQGSGGVFRFTKQL